MSENFDASDVTSLPITDYLESNKFDLEFSLFGQDSAAGGTHQNNNSDDEQF